MRNLKARQKTSSVATTYRKNMSIPVLKGDRFCFHVVLIQLTPKDAWNFNPKQLEIPPPPPCSSKDTLKCPTLKSGGIRAPKPNAGNILSLKKWRETWLIGKQGSKGKKNDGHKPDIWITLFHILGIHTKSSLGDTIWSSRRKTVHASLFF